MFVFVLLFIVQVAKVMSTLASTQILTISADVLVPVQVLVLLGTQTNSIIIIHLLNWMSTDIVTDIVSTDSMIVGSIVGPIVATIVGTIVGGRRCTCMSLFPQITSCKINYYTRRYTWH